MTIPYARPYWTEEEVDAVAETVRSGWWTSGKRVQQFEDGLRAATGAEEVVSVSSGTTALEALLTLVKRPGARSLFITSSLNFAGGPAAARHAGYDTAFTDIDPRSLNMSASSLRALLERTRGTYDQVLVMPVHFAGIPAGMDALAAVCAAYGAELAEDACHALGGRYSENGPLIGSHPASLGAVFSFHPNKPVAAAEGGAVSVRDPELAARLRLYRNHNMDRSAAAWERSGGSGETPDPWFYAVEEPGRNLRLSELHAAIGHVQLNRLPESLERRRTLARRYQEAFASTDGLVYLPAVDHGLSGWHLFPVSFDLQALGLDRRAVFGYFAERGITLQVHYIPLHLQPAFRAHLSAPAGFPHLDTVAQGMVSLPLFHGLTDDEHRHVVDTVLGLLATSAGRRP